jgi:uncharacterized protein related to proFAR isomerase
MITNENLKTIYKALNESFMYIAETEYIDKSKLLDNLEMCCDIMEEAKEKEIREAWEEYYKGVNESHEDFVIAWGFVEYLNNHNIKPL